MAMIPNIDSLEPPRMKILTTSLVLVLAIGGEMTAAAQTQPAPAAHEHSVQTAGVAPGMDVSPEAEAAVMVVDRFGEALAAGDMKTVETLLDPEVLILESGGAERGRAEYMSYHAIADAQFLASTHSQLKHRRARIAGGLAWVGSENELHASKDGKPMTLLSTETMVLKLTGGDWRIVHIHWSSRPE